MIQAMRLRDVVWVVAASLLVVTTSGCATRSALDVATERVRDSATKIQTDFSTAANSHASVQELVELKTSTSPPGRFGDYAEINSTTGAVDVVLVDRAQLGGGWVGDDETVVLCITYVINVEHLMSTLSIQNARKRYSISPTTWERTILPVRPK